MTLDGIVGKVVRASGDGSPRHQLVLPVAILVWYVNRLLLAELGRSRQRSTLPGRKNHRLSRQADVDPKQPFNY
jgi:hypothetical protein